jgi:xanthine dehydrogenase accessory factor
MVAQILARLGKAIDYEICVTAPGIAKENFASSDAMGEDFDLSRFGVTPQTFVVVATQGEGDEEGLEAAARSEAGYVAFVASRTKAQKISENLLDKGVSAGRVAVIKAPAGLQIGAVSPEEIAVSVLAEIVQVGRSRAPAEEKPGKKSAGAKVKPLEAKDPICGMPLDVPNVRYKSEYKGQTFYFCSSGCKMKFDSDPARHASPATASHP